MNDDVVLHVIDAHRCVVWWSVSCSALHYAKGDEAGDLAG